MNTVGGNIPVVDPRTSSVSTISTGGGASAATATATAATPGRTDQVNLTAPVNPYQGISDHSAQVAVDKWKQGPNDSIEHMLKHQGYSMEEIYKADSKGHNLIDRVASVNGLRDPNLVVAKKDRKMVVPSKHEAETPTPAQHQPLTNPAATPTTGQSDRPTQPHEDPQPTPTPSTPAPLAVTGPAGPGAATVPTPTTEVTPPVRAEGADVEVGMLLNGVKDGKFTRDEFQALNSTANQFTELGAKYAKDGVTPEQTQQLSQIQQQYGQMYSRFQADDSAHVRFEGGNSQDPTAQFHNQQNEAGGKLYDDFKAGRIDEAKMKEGLMAQRDESAQRGAAAPSEAAPAAAVEKHSFLYRVFHHHHQDAAVASLPTTENPAGPIGPNP